MAITLGTEMALSLHLDDQRSYSDVEQALIAAGFDDYSIIRNVNYDGSSDMQIYVRSNYDEATNNVEPLPATDTLSKLTDVLGALDDETSTPPA